MIKSRKDKRERRKLHIRRKISGTNEKPRIFVFKSNKYLYVGVADDQAGKVIASLRGGKNEKSASETGKALGKVLTEKKISKAVFDRSGYKFHTKLKALVDGLTESGISFS